MSDMLSDKEQANFIIYNTEDGRANVALYAQDGDIWLNQNQLAELFATSKQNIGQHIANILSEKELQESSVVKHYFTTASDGKNDQVAHYILAMILAIGFRVRSKRGVQFRRWANQHLHEYMVKGFVMDDERLKNGRYFGKDYFRKLLEHMCSIRASKRQIYQQITDIFAECSTDYQSQSKISEDFYATIQNKFHYAIHGQMAAELIYDKADAKQQNMGLQTWKNTPDGRILKSDSIMAKNYLSIDKIKQLERTISAFFDYIERIIENRNTFTM